MVFAQEVLGVRVWGRQAEILRAVAANPQVAVRSGHKVGKSTSAAILAFWWVCTRPDARVIMTSASGRQVKAVLWRELRRLYRKSQVPLGGKMHEAPDSGYQLPDGREVLGFSTNEPERMAGISGANILFILDEASGIPEEIFAAIEGNSAGGIRIVMFSNPTRTSGYFYDAFHTKAEFWHCIRVSSEETPNARTGRRVIPGLATKEWVEQKAKEYGRDSPFFDVRVLGNFPKQGSNALIALFLVDEAVKRYDETQATGSVLDIGLDVARFGDDDSVATPVRGRKAYLPEVVHGHDTIQVAEMALRVAMTHRDAKKNERVRIKVDAIGLGAGVYDQLAHKVVEQKLTWLEVYAINVAESATAGAEPEKILKEGERKPDYHRLRDQLWGAMRDWLKDGGALPEDPQLQKELVAPTYSFSPKGAIVVEDKDSLKSRLGCSPDHADSLCLAIYTPPNAGLKGAARLRAGASW